MSKPVRTRFAPSPTGYLHLGGARTALFSWAFARRHGGTFVLRVEDTDVERSTPAAVQAILDGMDWLGLDYDEGPFYQMQRLERYQAAIAQMLLDGRAYHCYCSPETLQRMREKQRERGDKPRYDGTWRPEAGKTLPEVPQGVSPVVRFRNPMDGEVTWDDMIKGPISISNHEMDDLIIARADGTPTYNFCVSVDDLEMGITHVIRGDDHVNNTPRQINILAALGGELPVYGHVPMILGPDGEKLSKRHGAVSVMQYKTEGFLPEAMINYLARLGWSHGDAEIFSRQDLVQWFDTSHVSRSPAQWDPKKLAWVNHHYLKGESNTALAHELAPFLRADGIERTETPTLEDVVALYKDRSETFVELAASASLFYRDLKPDPALLAEHVKGAVIAALGDFVAAAQDIDWTREAIGALIKTVLAAHQLKMPQLAVPLRVITTGQTQTPSVDAVLALLGHAVVRERIEAALQLVAAPTKA